MKRLLIIFSYYHGSIPAMISLALLFSITLFLSANAIGTVSVYSLSHELYRQANIKNSFYFMPKMNLQTGESEEVDTKKVESFSAVQDIIQTELMTLVLGGTPNKYVNVTLCSDAYLDAFHVADEGSWLDTPESGQGVDIVVSGYLFSGLRVGEQLALINPYNGKTVHFHIAGKKKEPAYQPTFGAWSNEVDTEDLTTQGHNTIFMRKSEQEKVFNDSEDPILSLNCWIRLKPDASTAERKELTDYLANNGALLTYDEIMLNSANDFSYQLKKNGYIPVFLLSITLIFFVSTAVLMMRRKSKEMRAYFLCGYSRKRCFADCFSAIALIGLLAGMLNTLYVLMIPFIYQFGFFHDLWPTGKMAIGNQVLAFIWGYILICIIISALLSNQFRKSISAMEQYRRHT